MSHWTPRKPTGNTSQASWARAVHEEVFEVLRNLSSPHGRFKRMGRGITFILDKLPQPAAAPDWANPIVYDHTRKYKKGELVVIRPTDAVVVTGVLDIATGKFVKAMAGTWKATQDAAPETSETSPLPIYHLPVWPLPTPNDPDAENVYWWPMSAYPMETPDCSNSTVYIANASVKPS